MSESMIVGVDHGYAAMKTAHFSFPSGLVAYEHEPYTLKDVLEYGGKFYVVGSGRQALQKNKNADRGLLPPYAGSHRKGALLPSCGACSRDPSGGRTAPHQLWTGEKCIPGLSAPGWENGEFPL